MYLAQRGIQTINDTYTQQYNFRVNDELLLVKIHNDDQTYTKIDYLNQLLHSR